MRTLIALARALFLFIMTTPGAPLYGAKAVGPTGNYASLTDAIAAIQTQALGGALVL